MGDPIHDRVSIDENISTQVADTLTDKAVMNNRQMLDRGGRDLRILETGISTTCLKIENTAKVIHRAQCQMNFRGMKEFVNAPTAKTERKIVAKYGP